MHLACLAVLYGIDNKASHLKSTVWLFDFDRFALKKNVRRSEAAGRSAAAKYLLLLIHQSHRLEVCQSVLSSASLQGRGASTPVLAVTHSPGFRRRMGPWATFFLVAQLAKD
ncbi:hypothetical protein CMUS01_02622 [Colletotrichum musicola]|uniref:Uncharacterized protein n=1 Tax=Colletotrichum musicola TaxID=2175873 RepID=A0A8H6U7B0_9PEZI|nr:hypothetical protein CMUS01_02622 [Colletotrichum musicola]